LDYFAVINMEIKSSIISLLQATDLDYLEMYEYPEEHKRMTVFDKQSLPN
jgi:hypothetical protein